MVWKKITGHINHNRIRVESKDGHQYPVETEYDQDNEMVYSHMMNPKNEWDLWANVYFEDETPFTDEITTGGPGKWKDVNPSADELFSND